MAERYTYFVPLVVHHGGQLALTARIVTIDTLLNSEEAVIEMIDNLTRDIIEGEVEEGDLPVVPLGWTLITAKRGPAVPPLDPKAH